MDQIHNAQNRRSNEITNHVYVRYKNYVIPRGKHMFKSASDMEMTTICAYTSSQYYLPHWKCVLRCCAEFPQINMPSFES